MMTTANSGLEFQRNIWYYSWFLAKLGFLDQLAEGFETVDVTQTPKIYPIDVTGHSDFIVKIVKLYPV